MIYAFIISFSLAAYFALLATLQNRAMQKIAQKYAESPHTAVTEVLSRQVEAILVEMNGFAKNLEGVRSLTKSIQGRINREQAREDAEPLHISEVIPTVVEDLRQNHEEADLILRGR